MKPHLIELGASAWQTSLTAPAIDLESAAHQREYRNDRE